MRGSTVYIAVLHSSLSSPIQNRECNGLQTQHIPLEYACLERPVYVHVQCICSYMYPYMYVPYTHNCTIQWNLSNPDNLETEESVLISEVS